MKASFLSGRLRLIDGVVIAAGALLVLKLISLMSSTADDIGPDGLPRFAHVLSHARSNYIPPDPTTTGSVPDKKKEEPQAPPVESPLAAPPGQTTSPAERAIYDRLGDRREELQKRARDLETRQKLIEEEERRLDSKRSESASDEQAAAAKAAQPDPSLKSLAVMYETMKPKEAARVFDRLSHDVLVPVVRLIAPRKMADILAAMTPENAEKLTVALARGGRASEAPSVGLAVLPAGELPAIEPAGGRPGSRPRPARP